MNEDARTQGSVTSKALGLGGAVALTGAGIAAASWGVGKVGKGIGKLGEAVNSSRKSISKNYARNQSTRSAVNAAHDAEAVARKKFSKKMANMNGQSAKATSNPNTAVAIRL